MKSKQIDSSMEALLIFALTSSWFLVWVAIVDPVPDRDSVHQLLVPFLDSLKASQETSNPFFLRYYFNEAYPLGIAWISSIISNLALADVFAQIPWLLNLIPIAILSWTLSLLRTTGKIRIVTAILIICCPMFQIALHSFSFHGIISILTLSALLLLRESIILEDRQHLLRATVLLIISSSLKHLGLFQYLLVLITMALFLSNRQNQAKYAFHFWILLIGFIISLLFYPLHSVKIYTLTVFTHNPLLSPNLVVITTLISLILGTLLWFLIRLRQDVLSSYSKKLQIHENLTFRFFFWGVGLMIFLVCYPIAQHSLHWVLISTVISILWICRLSLFFSFYSKKSWDYLLSVILIGGSAVLYCSLLGQVAMNFFAPLMLILSIYSLEFKSAIRKSLLILIFIVSSTMFPGVKKLESVFWHWGHLIYTRGFNGLQVNPLSFEKSRLQKVRIELRKALEGVDFFPFLNEVPVLLQGMHFHTRQQLLFSHYLHYPFLRTVQLQFAAGDHLKSLAAAAKQDLGIGSHDYRENSSNLSNYFKKLIDQSKIPVIITAIDPLTSFPIPSRTTLSVSDETNFETFAVEFNDVFLALFKLNLDLRKDYQKFELGRKGFRLFIHQSFINQSRINYRARFDLRLQLQAQMFQKFSSKNRYGLNLQAESFRANLYHQEAAELMNQRKFMEAWIALKMGLSLVGTHQEIEKDLAQLESILENDLISNIDARREQKWKRHGIK